MNGGTHGDMDVSTVASGTPGQRVLFTAFEPSGDDHAASVIETLRRRHPGIRIDAWGGPKMEAAGATIVERTGDDAVMGIPGLAKIRQHQRINARIRAWLDENPVSLHVPVDSPAANFPVCHLAKARGIRVVHLVAPQVWAWGSWRIRKLRRLTDLVLCLLPFEEPWFRARNVPARFIGHPIFDRPLDEAALQAKVESWGHGSTGPRIALMPGSRPAEMRRNFPLLIEAYRRLARDYEGLTGVVAATRHEAEPVLRELAREAAPDEPWPESLNMVFGETDAATRWADIALVVSGTVTLQIAKQHRPMVIVYKSNRLLWSLLASWLVRTPFFTLPNLIAGEEIVPELIPHFGGSEPIVQAAVELLENPGVAGRQRQRLADIAERFRGMEASSLAAEAIAEMLGLREAGRAPAETYETSPPSTV